ncbi:MAG: insulinase family protein [Pyrinomonadaceae bacterium]|nr:insulinase family protein [Pyrinomonadaceae bacterium]
MNTRNYLNKSALAALILFAAASFSPFSFAQTAKSSAPRQEKLLNNLKLLMWQDAGTDKVTVKLRVHSGAAFDTLNKEGTMAMLADALFPNESVKEFFRDDLGGSLEVSSNYDYLQIRATGNADQVLTILETVAAAITKPTLDKETTAKVKTARLERIKELEKNPSYIADLAVAKRLFGNYPYGRSAEGTTESLTKIDFADLILAKQRFLTADNATLAVSGNIKYDYVFKAVRQLFGGWEKADKKVPATFAQPNALNEEIAKVYINNLDQEFARNAFNGVARSDKDYFPSVISTKIWNARLNKFPDGFVRNEPHLLRGMIVWGLSFNDEPSSKTINDKNKNLKEVTAEEFAKAKTDLLSEMNQKNTVDWWLDVDTFKLVSVKDEMQQIASLTIGEVNQYAAKLQKAPNVTIFFEKQN